MTAAAGRSAPTVAILGHVGKHNMGDEAIIEALIAGLRRAIVPVNLVAFTMNPADTAERHNVAAHPIRPNAGPLQPESPAASEPPAGTSQGWRRRLKGIAPLRWSVLAARAVVGSIRAVIVECRFSLSSYSRLKGANLVIVAGSGQVADYFGGPILFPWSLFRWTILGRLVGAKVAYVSNGCGPLDYGLSRWLIRRALRLSAYRSYRDPSSLKLARGVGSPEPSRLVHDLAFSLPGLHVADGRPSHARPRVGLNALPYCSGSYWYVADESRHDRYLQVHAEASVKLVEQGFDVVLFSTQDSDPKVARQIAERASRVSASAMAHVRVAPFVPKVQDTLALIRSCDLVVATRYHGLLLSIAQGVPVVGISYHPKSVDLLDAVGLRDYCVDVESIDPGGLTSLTLRAWASNTEIRRRLIQCLPALTAEVIAQYTDLAALLTDIIR